MGREIRRVPLGWQHPRATLYGKDNGLQPLHDETYASAARQWLDDCIAWENGTHPRIREDASVKDTCPYWWDYAGPPPNEEYYRPEWPATAVLGWAMYENVTEGTPVSPTFATAEGLENWLVDQGHSRNAAARFMQLGYASSFVMTIGENGAARMDSGIDAYDTIPSKE